MGCICDSYEDYDRYATPSCCEGCLEGGHNNYDTDIEFKGVSFCAYCFKDKDLVFNICGLDNSKTNNEAYNKLLKKINNMIDNGEKEI
jgi:hypothetical protein